MKIVGAFLLFFVGAALGAGLPDFLRYKEGDRYFWNSDVNGKPYRVDLYETETESRFNPQNDIVFRLFTRSNPTNGQVITFQNVNSLTNSNYDRNKRTKLISHGWNSNGNSAACTLPRTRFLNALDVNVICIDWGIGANVIYTTAVNNVPPTGQMVARFVDWLVSQGSPVGNFHIVGHSLGGHVAGIAGRNVNSGRIPYITAFDPANPLWGSGSQRIRPSDGNYVEIIHTDSGNLGLEEPVGHNDFYPNGGKNMPGCGVVDVSCSHSRSYEYFAYSLDHTQFMSNQCSNYPELAAGNCANLSRLHMGGANPKAARGVFWLATGANPPFHLG